jgi:hypothetical protein
MSIGENYERNITLIRSDISGFSRGTTTPLEDVKMAAANDKPEAGTLAELQKNIDNATAALAKPKAEKVSAPKTEKPQTDTNQKVGSSSLSGRAISFSIGTQPEVTG